MTPYNTRVYFNQANLTGFEGMVVSSGMNKAKDFLLIHLD